MRSIPKIIHYCWFGRGKKPKVIMDYVSTWEQNLPEYKFIEWNEDNVNIAEEIDYVKEAYNAKKYAFVSDYIRLKALYEYGGIYLDTDVEILRPFESYLEDVSMVLGFESQESLLTAFIAVEKENVFIYDFMSSYKGRNFLLESGEYDLTTINYCFTAFSKSLGINPTENIYQESNNVKVYPIEYFCGFDVVNWHPSVTENTYTIHHMASSWVSGKRSIKGKIIILLQNTIGIRKYDRLRKLLKR